MKIGIVGLGLIGGSLGLKLQSLNHTIYGIANNEFNEKKARDKKLATFVSCDLSLLKKCELIILALPIKDLISPSQELVSSIPRETILTDVGSVKEPIVNTWENLHPLLLDLIQWQEQKKKELIPVLKVFLKMQNGSLHQHKKVIYMRSALFPSSSNQWIAKFAKLRQKSMIKQYL